MKKVLIALLSLAMLFSFVACDNSSDTPAPEPTPGDELIVTTPMIQDFATSINGLLDGSYAIANSDDTVDKDATKVSDLLVTLDKETFSATDTTASVSTKWYEVNAPVMAGETVLIPGDKVMLTVSGNYTREANSTDATLVLTDYTYAFDLNRKDSDGEYAAFTGSFSGKFVTGTLEIAFAETTSTIPSSFTVKPGVDIVILLPTAADYKDVKIGDLAVTGDQLFNFVTATAALEASDDVVADGYYANANYVAVREDELATAVDNGVSQLFTELASALNARIKYS